MYFCKFFVRFYDGSQQWRIIMAIEVTFELQDSDLEYFKDVMQKAKASGSSLSESQVLSNAKSLSEQLSDQVPAFVQERLKKLNSLIAMIEDSEWQIPEEEKVDVISALTYFSDPEDIVPDDIPVLGYLDDAIMIELVARELNDDIEAFEEFCAYREREEARNGEQTVTREDWLGAKRRELHSRMRNRRREKRKRSGFRSIF